MKKGAIRGDISWKNMSPASRGDARPKNPTPAPASKPGDGINHSQIRYEVKAYEPYALPPHVHPLEFQVHMTVNSKHLGLSKNGLQAMQSIVGLRYNKNKKILSLKANRFESRVENRKLVIAMLEQVVSEAERLGADLDKFDAENAVA
jgi:hypothetical protein